MSKAIKWGAVLAFILLGAFVLGVVFTAGAQEIPDDPDPVVVTPVGGMVETTDGVGVETFTEYVPSEQPTFYASSTLGSATKPTSGDYIYLIGIDRYISVPSDVRRFMVISGLCLPPETGPNACADPVVYLFRKGSAEAGISHSGTFYGSEADKAIFPFLVEDEEEDEE